MTIPQNPPAYIPSLSVTAETVHIKCVDEASENVTPVVVPMAAPIASTSTVPPPQPTSRPKTRARSGSFSYFPGNTYASGNPAPQGVQLTPSGCPPPTLVRLPYNVQNGERIPPARPTAASKSSTPTRSAAYSPYAHSKPDSARATLLYSNATFNSLTSFTPIIPPTRSILPSKAQQEREAASKYLAGVILRRGFGSKMPPRKRASSRAYVKSRLSSSVGVDC